MTALVELGPVIAGRAVRIGHRSPELVSSAASLFDRYRLAEKAIRVGERVESSGVEDWQRHSLEYGHLQMDCTPECPGWAGVRLLKPEPMLPGFDDDPWSVSGGLSSAVEPERWIGRSVAAEGQSRAGGLDRWGRVRSVTADGAVAGGERLEQEGPRWRVEISPGSVKIARTDPVKRDRARARAAAASKVSERLRRVWHEQGPDLPRHEACWGWCSHTSCQQQWANHKMQAKIMAWSAKSRRSMIHRLATLDYAPLFVKWLDGEQTCPAMVTLTYPGDWLAVAPSNKAVRRHVDQLRKRWDRQWGGLGFPLVGVWKREFQERGAPHFHILCVPPNVPEFREWLSETWAEIVGASWCGRECWKSGKGCCERGRHVNAGTGVDFREGARATDPRRLAVYFAKHGSFAAKEYQNEGPAEWATNGGLGRFWGVWGLSPAVAVVGVSPELGLMLARTLRRLERSKRFTMPVRLLRCTRAEIDVETGEVLHSHTRGCFRNNTITVARFKGSAGYVVVNDGAALASALSRVAALVEPDPSSRVYRELTAERGRALLSGRWWSSTGRCQGFLP